MLYGYFDMDLAKNIYETRVLLAILGAYTLFLPTDPYKLLPTLDSR